MWLNCHAEFFESGVGLVIQLTDFSLNLAFTNIRWLYQYTNELGGDTLEANLIMAAAAKPSNF
jgi:hypothetical protein